MSEEKKDKLVEGSYGHEGSREENHGQVRNLFHCGAVTQRGLR